MRRKQQEKLENFYNAYKTRRNERVVIKLFFIFVVAFVTYNILSAAPNSLIQPVLKQLILAAVFSASFVVIFSYWWMDPTETRISLYFYRAYKRLGFYFEDKEKLHLYFADSHINYALIEMNDLIPKRTDSIYQEIANPLKKLRKGVFEKIIPLNAKRQNLKQIHEKIGNLAILFLNPKKEKILNFNRTLESIPPSRRENLFKKYFSNIPKPMVIFLKVNAVIFGIIIISYLIFGFNFVQIILTILTIMGSSASITYVIEKVNAKRKRKGLNTSSIKKT